MKKIKSLIIVVLGICVFYACRKNDNPKLPDGIAKGVMPQLTQDTTGDILIQDMTKFKTSFNLGLYFPSGPKPQKMDVRVVMNNKYNNVKTLQAGVTTFPTQIQITGPQLAQLFALDPATVPSGTTFTVAPDVTTQDGKTYPAFNYGVNGTDTFLISPYGGDVNNFPGAVLNLQYTKVCPLNMHAFGNETTGVPLTVVDNDFWGATYSVQGTLDPADSTTLILTGWVQDPGAVVKVKVNPRTQGATVAKQIYLPILPGTSYHNPAVAGSGKVNACNNSISLTLTNTVTEGSFGTANVVIKR
ncbi:hypothetical protein [Chitinophaga vietnamensis]|uniref:hypothetical protein n=1 Tax=Chitinophaga vietnamensis TaxID=2593957 RepID=UPI001178B9C5|nr:hypothetical protein [Chitinophaga vietnamensis]